MKMTPRYIPPNLRLEPGEAEARKQLDVERRGGTAALAAALDKYGSLPRQSSENRSRSSLDEYRASEKLGYSGADEDTSWWHYALAWGPTPKNMLEKPERRALSRASGAAGDFLIPTDVEQEIISAGPQRVSHLTACAHDHHRRWANAQGAVLNGAWDCGVDRGERLRLPVG